MSVTDGISFSTVGVSRTSILDVSYTYYEKMMIYNCINQITIFHRTKTLFKQFMQLLNK